MNRGGTEPGPQPSAGPLLRTELPQPPESASAAGLHGHWLPPPSITAPSPIATRGSEGLPAGALGPAWANRVGEGGRRPRRAAKTGGLRWR